MLSPNVVMALQAVPIVVLVVALAFATIRTIGRITGGRRS